VAVAVLDPVRNAMARRSRDKARPTNTTARPVPPAPVPARPAPTAIALDVCRHALPLVALYLRHGSIPSYLVLTAFDLALGLMLIVGTTRDARDPTTVDPRATRLVSRATAVVVLALFLGSVAAFVTVPIAMPALILGWGSGVEWGALMSERSFVGSVAFMALSAGVRAQHRFEAATTSGEIGTSPHAAPVIGDLAGDRRRSQATYAAQVTLIGTYVFLSYVLSVLGSWGSFVFPVVYAALLVAYDARPDLAARLLPDLWPGTQA
jgi:hypothetical protein